MNTTDFNDAVILFAARINTIKRSCKTEESTKHSLILPFIRLLGYDIFDPTEVVPEVDCDIRKSGDKVDYVIQHNASHIILIECKHWTKDLDNFVNQLSSYFVASKARFGILTNGIQYRFFADLEKANLMDNEPFLVVDMENLTEDSLEGLYMFCKDTFNEQLIIDKGREIRRMNALRKSLQDELTNPSYDFVTFFARRVYGQVPSKAVREQFKPLLIKAISEYTRHIEVEDNGQPRIEASSLGVLGIVQSILSNTVPADRVQLFTGTGYSSIRLDGSQWFPIIKFGTNWITLGKYRTQSKHFYCQTKDNKQYIDTPSDIFKYAADITDIVTVMLIGDGHDDERTKWVIEHRPDWCN